MRKSVFFIVAIVVVLGRITLVHAAEENQVEKVSTLILLKQDWIMPEQGKSFDSQGLSIYWHESNFGAGIDVNMTRQSEFLQVKPYLTLNQGPWYLVGGVSHGDAGDFSQAGFWYLNQHGKLSVLVDIRNNFGLDKNSASFLDCFVEVKYPLGGSNFFVGVNAVYDRWWQGDHTWLMAGPLVGYKFTKQVSAFVRVTHEWDVLEKEVTESNRFRIGLMFNF